MSTTRVLTDKPITREVVEEDGKTVAVHTTTVVTDPTAANAVQVPSSQEYPSANATDRNELAVLSREAPGDALDTTETSVDEVQRIDPTGTVSGGTYDFVILPGTDFSAAVDGVAFDATVATVQTALDAALGAAATDGEDIANVVVSGVAVGSGNLDFTFSGGDVSGTNQPILTVDDGSITGGGSLAAVTVTPGVHADA